MITKEKLQNGYILNDKGVLRQKFVDASEFHGFDTDWMDGDINTLDGDICFIDSSNNVNGYYGHVSELHEIVINQLTLEDFNEAPKNDTGSVSKWKYTPIEIESIFDWKDALESGNLYHEDGDDVGKIGSEWKLINILVEDKCQVYFREEIKWQDEVSQYVLEEGITYSCNGAKHIKALSEYTDEQFLEMCRIALRSTGELK